MGQHDNGEQHEALDIPEVVMNEVNSYLPTTTAHTTPDEIR